MFDRVLVVDLGAQYARLIARRVREAHVYSEIVPRDITVAQVKEMRPAGIIRVGKDRVDAVSEGTMIRRGAAVEILAWREGHAVVREVPSEVEPDAEEKAEADADAEEDS